MTARAYGRLMAGGGGDPFDRHLFACVFTVVRAESGPSLAVGLGLSAEALAVLVGSFFPHAPDLLTGLDPAIDGSEAITADEERLRALLLENRSLGTIEETCLAHIIARRALEPHLLWQDLGLSSRADLSLLLIRHFAPLAARNIRDMRWKPFFWREIEALAGHDCRTGGKCRRCSHQRDCFGPEAGASFISLTSGPALLA